jgi:hypothetical protein
MKLNVKWIYKRQKGNEVEKWFAENNLEKIWSYNLNPPKLEESKDESTIHSLVDLTPFLEFLQKCIN